MKNCFWCGAQSDAIQHNNEDGHAFVTTAAEALDYNARLVARSMGGVDVIDVDTVREIARHVDARVEHLEKQRDELQAANTQLVLEKRRAHGILDVIGNEERMMWLSKKWLFRFDKTRWPFPPNEQIELDLVEFAREVISGKPA